MRVAVGVALIVIVGVASAGPLPRNGLDGDDKGWFYNRPGVELAVAETDLAACTSFATAMVSPRRMGYGSGLVSDIIDSIEDAGLARAITDDCMIARGYRRFDTTDRNIRTFEQRYQTMTADARAALVASETPSEGILARQWANTLWTYAPGQRPSNSREYEHLPVRHNDSSFPWVYIRPLNSASPIALGPSDAVVIATIKLDSPAHSRPGVTFTRIDPQTGAPDPSPAGRRARQSFISFSLDIALRRRLSGPPWTTQQVYVVPAGTYAMTTAAEGDHAIDLCLGTLGFTVNAGEILDIGEFVVTPEAQPAELSPSGPFSLRLNSPDLNNDRALLARAPELMARIQAVEIRDGEKAACLGDGRYFQPFGIDMPYAAQVE